MSFRDISFMLGLPVQDYADFFIPFRNKEIVVLSRAQVRRFDELAALRARPRVVCLVTSFLHGLATS